MSGSLVSDSGTARSCIKKRFVCVLVSNLVYGCHIAFAAAKDNRNRSCRKLQAEQVNAQGAGLWPSSPKIALFSIQPCPQGVNREVRLQPVEGRRKLESGEISPLCQA
jgi:hypothetical protein